MTSETTLSNSDISIDSSKIPRTANTSPATWFDYTEVSGTYWASDTDWYRTKKEDYFEHLATLNQGKKVAAGRFNTRYETYMMNRDLIDALASQLNLTQRQRNKARRHFLGFNLDEWGIRAEHLAYSVCQFVVHTDEEDNRKCHPHSDIDDVPDAFKRVRDSVKLPPGSMASVYGKVQHELSTNSIGNPVSHDQYGLGSLHENQL